MATILHKIMPVIVLESEAPEFIMTEIKDGITENNIANNLIGDAWGDYVFTTKEKYKCIISQLNWFNLKNFITINVNKYTSLYKTLSHKNYVMNESWVNYNYKYSFQNTHTHGSSQISGVFYVRVRGDGEDGDICFPAPIEFKEMIEIYKIRPKIGKLLIFHSSLAHYVTYNKTDDTRISLSFNYKAK